MEGNESGTRISDQADYRLREGCPPFIGGDGLTHLRGKDNSSIALVCGLSQLYELASMARRLRVGHVTPSYHPAKAYGGPPESVYQLTAHLARAGVEVRVLTTNADGKETLDVGDVETELEPRLRVRYTKRWSDHVAPSLLLQLPELASWADVLHLNGVYSFTTYPTLLAARAAGKPLIWSSRGALQRWEGGRKKQLKRAWEIGCRIVAPAGVVLHVTSEEEGRESASQLPEAKIQIVHNGVLVPSDLPARVHAPHGVLRLGSLGRLHPIKGLENLLEALALLREEPAKLPVRLDIAGEGDARYTRTLQELARSLGLEQIVRFVGPRHAEKKRDFFLDTDLFVAPSHRENFGIAIAEALAHGVPALTGRGAPWSVLVERRAGYWVSNDPRSLASTIRLASEAPLLEMGARARELASAELGWEGVAHQMASIYENVASKAPGRH